MENFGSILALFWSISGSFFDRKFEMFEIGCCNLYEILANTRTDTDMDGTLHTDLWKSETSREIKKSF